MDRTQYQMTVVVDPTAEYSVSYVSGDVPGTGKLILRPDADPHDIGVILKPRVSTQAPHARTPRGA